MIVVHFILPTRDWLIQKASRTLDIAFMRKTNHILYAVLTLLTAGIGGIGWGIIALRNWAYNESRGYNDLKRGGHHVTPSFVEPRVRYSSHGSFVLASITLVDGRALVTPKRSINSEGPKTYLPKAPVKKKSLTAEAQKREFVLDQELTEMFEEIGVRDPADMQKIIDAALADTSTALPRNRLLLSFGNYARTLIKTNDLHIGARQED